MTMLCDVCGRKFRPEQGQVTADTILCGECTRRVADRSAELVREATEPVSEYHKPDLGDPGA
jgi:hypothetical protein